MDANRGVPYGVIVMLGLVHKARPLLQKKGTASFLDELFRY